jgi:hypothetical protein
MSSTLDDFLGAQLVTPDEGKPVRKDCACGDINNVTGVLSGRTRGGV